MTTPPPPRALLVLGMHRAGTSAVTRLINLLGADLGGSLLPPAADNTSGFWENSEIVAFHHEVLKAARSDWDDIRPIDPKWFETKTALRLTDDLVDLIRQVFGPSPLIAMKDPRACRLVPLWRNALARTGHRVSAVLPWRPAGEVAHSLKARDGFDPLRAGLLWVHHIAEAERGTRDMPRSIVSFDAVLSDWQGTAARLSRDLDLDWPVPPTAIADRASAFLDPAARHHRDRPLRATEIRPYAAAVEAALADCDWSVLRQACSAGEAALAPMIGHVAPVVAAQIAERRRWEKQDETTRKSLSRTSDRAIAERDRAQAAFEEMRAAYRAAQAQLKEARAGLEAFQADNRRLEEAVAAIRRDFAVETAYRRELQTAVDHRQAAADHYRAEYDAAIQQRDEAVAGLDHYRTEYAAAIQQRDTLDSALADATATREGLGREVDRLTRLLGDAEASIATLADANDGLATALDEARSEIDAQAERNAALEREQGHLQAELADAQAALLRVDTHLGDTRHLLFAARAELNEANRAHDMLSVRFRQVTTTLSWRATRPFRVLYRFAVQAFRPLGQIWRYNRYGMALVPLSGAHREADGFRMIGHEARFRIAATRLTQPTGWCWFRLHGSAEDTRLAASLFIPPTGAGSTSGYHPLL